MNKLQRWWRRFRKSVRQRLQEMKAPGRFLCDSCRYDYGTACRNPKRPNVSRCPEYRQR